MSYIAMQSVQKNRKTITIMFVLTSIFLYGGVQEIKKAFAVEPPSNTTNGVKQGAENLNSQNLSSIQLLSVNTIESNTTEKNSNAMLAQGAALSPQGTTTVPQGDNSTSESTTASSAGATAALEKKYPSFETVSPYRPDEFLTQKELLTSGFSGIFIFLGGVVFLLIAKQLRAYARRKKRHLDSGLLSQSIHDIQKYYERAKSHHLLGILLVFAASGIFLGTVYAQQIKINRPIVFSKETMLKEIWEDYKTTYVTEDGRTLDRQRNNYTTSEGQSYTMLRAVWMNDKQTFDKAFQWANTNLKQDDGLFAWFYGALPDGSQGVIESEGGQNSATDADSDIALALIFAYSRWNDQLYLEEAKSLLNSLWEREVVIINNQPYLAANNQEKNSGSKTIVVNPSYFSPYAYRIFAQVDPSHNWLGLVDTSYSVIEKSMELPLDKTKSVNLPPNFIFVDRITGQVTPAEDTNYGFDAMRLPWRLALDNVWFGEERATEVLTKMEFLGKEWSTTGKLDMTYSHDGAVVHEGEAAAMYGGAIGYFKVVSPSEAKAVYKDKLEILYSPDNIGWKQSMSYYDDNWAWFGMALANDKLPNLASRTDFTSKIITP